MTRKTTKSKREIYEDILAQLPPPHPGRVLAAMLEGFSISDAAKKMGISRSTLNRLLDGENGISAQMAFRLSVALKTSVEFWLELQMEFDAWHVRHDPKLIQSVKPLFEAERLPLPTQEVLHFTEEEDLAFLEPIRMHIMKRVVKGVYSLEFAESERERKERERMAIFREEERKRKLVDEEIRRQQLIIEKKKEKARAKAVAKRQRESENRLKMFEEQGLTDRKLMNPDQA